jgi:HEAT repeat protein
VKKWIVRTALGCAGVILLTMLALAMAHRLYPEPHAGGRPLSEWLVQLRDSNPAKRQEAAEALRAMGPEAIPYLTGELTRPPNAFQRAARGASKYAPAFLKRRLERMQQPDKEVVNKYMALQAIGLLGTNAANATPSVGEVLRQSNMGLMTAAARALVHLGTNSLPELIAALDDGRYDTRAHACYALGMLGKDAAPAVPRLGRIVLDERGPIAATAALTLARLGEPAVPLLTEFLGHTNIAVQKWGAVGLTHTTSPPISAIPALIEAAKDPDAELRAAAVQAIGVIDRTSPESERVLVAALDDPNPAVRLAAARAALVRPRLLRQNQERFHRLLEDEDEEVRIAAVGAIGQSGQHGSGAIPKLMGLLGDTNAAVRQSASNALSIITNSMEKVRGRKAQPN